jgi:hypothetical protein
MKKDAILGVLFFGTLWGVSEVFLGEPLYRSGFDFPSVPLCIVALIILTISRAYLPQRGAGTLIACCAAVYKLTAMLTTFVGTPVYACHLLGIVCFGLAYDLVFSALSKRSKAVCAVAASYLGYALFAFAITYVARYQPWVRGGMAKVWTALGGAILVPLSFRLVQLVKQRTAWPLRTSPRLAAGALSVLTAGLWVVGMTVSL